MIIIIVPSPVQTLTLGIHFIIIPGKEAAMDRYVEYARRVPGVMESYRKYKESEPEGEQLILCVHYEYYLTSASFVSGLTGLELIKCYVDSLGENAAKSAVSISDGLILILYVCNNVRYLWMSWG